MRLKYQDVKELCQLLTNARIKIKDTKDISKSLKKLKWSSKQHHLTLMEYKYHFTNFCNIPNTLLLDEVISKLDELVASKSKTADYEELKSDIKWLKEYYKKESWSDVTRWLTNIDSTLRETFSNYIEAIKERRKDGHQWKSKEKHMNSGDGDDD